MRALSLILPAVSAFALACSCSGDNTAAVPRQRAYPRLVVADSLYRPLSLNGLALEVNVATVDSISPAKDNSSWLNIIYPTYCNGSVIYTTVTPVTDATRQQVLDNRVERIALNLGGNEAEVTEFENHDGWNCQIIKSMSPVVTPIQFIATNQRFVITGAYYINETGDSVKPYVDAVGRDIVHLLKTLRAS